MNNIIAVSSNSYHGFNIDDALAGIAAAGFKHIELTAVRGWTEHIMPQMTSKEKQEIIRKLQTCGLSCIALSGHCNLMDHERLNDFRLNMKLANELGCSYIVSSAGEVHFSEEEGRISDGILVENINQLLPDLEKQGLKLVLETHGAYGTGESLYRVTKKINSKLVGINYDTANVVYFSGQLPDNEIKTCVDDIKYVHLKDKIGLANVWNYPAIGKGQLALRNLIYYMKTVNYQGPYSVEVEFTESFGMKIKQKEDLQVVNQAIQDSYDFLASIGLI